MKSSKRVVIVLLIVTALSAAVVSPAAAATPGPQAPSLSCESGACQLVGPANGLLGLLRGGANQALDQLAFQTTAEGGLQATLDAQKEVKLSLPVGELTLTNARLQVEVGKDGKITRLNGTADMPFPTFGLLDSATVIAPARASVGLDLGKNLPDSGFQPVPDRPYLFFSANTFMNMAGRTAGSANDFSMSLEPGQKLTLVVDTVEPVAYLNGHVTLSITDQIALLGGILENTPLGPYVPNTLPLRERTQYGLSGKFNKDLSQSELTLRGGYVIDAGFLPAQLGIDARLVNIAGQFTLTRDGALVDGLVRSSIEPDKVFDGQLEVKTYIPFRDTSGPAFASLEASAKVPAVKVAAEGGARASAGQYELNGQVSTPFTASAIKGTIAGKLPDVAGTVGPAAVTFGSAVGGAASDAATAVGTTAARAGQAIGSTANKAANFVGPFAGRASEALAGYARFGRSLAEDAIGAGRAKLDRSDALAGAQPEM